MSSFRVHVTKDYTVLCSGHFITFEGDKCEGLRGRNYRAAVTVEGALNDNAYVFDCVRLKKMLRAESFGQSAFFRKTPGHELHA
jgi:6-pyruvoyltetrahydropterin/6-carboxytetrahydropterin synthase